MNIAKSDSRNNNPQFNRPRKSGSGKSIKIFVGVRGFFHTRNARRAYFLAVDNSGSRVAGEDFLLQREITREKALAFATIRARQWQAENHSIGSTIICLRPGAEYGR